MKKTNMKNKREERVTGKSIVNVEASIAKKENEIELLKKHMSPLETSLQDQVKNSKGITQEKADLLKQRQHSFYNMQMRIAKLNKEIEIFKKEKDELEQKLLDKQKVLRLLGEEEGQLDKLSYNLHYEAAKLEESFKMQLEDFESQRQAILNDSTLSEQEKTELLLQLSQSLNKYKSEYEEKVNLIDSKRTAAQKLSKDNARRKSAAKDALQEEINAELKDLEQLKMFASPSELAEINLQIKQLQLKNANLIKAGSYVKNIDNLEASLNRLNALKVGKTESEILKIEMEIEELKNDYKIRTGHSFRAVGQSDEKYFQNKLEDELKKLNASKIGKTQSEIFKIDMEIERIKNDFKHKTGQKEFPHRQGSENVSKNYHGADLRIESQAELQQQMAEYVKETVGVPLKMGIAYLCGHKPNNPINCLSNFLLQYRYKELSRGDNCEKLSKIINTKNGKQLKSNA